MTNIAAAIALVGIIATNAYERVHSKKEGDADWFVAILVMILILRVLI